MLIEDSKGVLSTLRAEMKDNQQIKSSKDLNIGDIVYQDLDKKDGLILNKGYDNRLKYFVIVGKNSKGDAIGLCLINSNLDFYKNVPAMQPFQYILKADNYKGILTKDSRLDCAKLFTIKAKKSVAVKAEHVGHLTEEDKAKVIDLVSSCKFIDAHNKKVYRIGQK